MLAFLDGPELIVVVVLLVVLVGANRLPKLARQLGQAQQELKKGLAEGYSGEKAPAPDTPAATGTDAATAAPVASPSPATAAPVALPAPPGPLEPPDNLRPPLPPPGS